jgi:hypothetical protein
MNKNVAIKVLGLINVFGIQGFTATWEVQL